MILERYRDVRRAVESMFEVDTLNNVVTLEMVFKAMDSLGEVPPEIKLTREEEERALFFLLPVTPCLLERRRSVAG